MCTTETSPGHLLPAGYSRFHWPASVCVCVCVRLFTDLILGKPPTAMTEQLPTSQLHSLPETGGAGVSVSS